MITPSIPATMMMWALDDRPILDAGMLRESYEDIRSRGFEGIELFVRCSRFSWADEAARRAIAKISGWCLEDGLAFWLGADPRFVAEGLHKARHRMTVLAYGDSTTPRIAPVLRNIGQGGRYRDRCLIEPRVTHILSGGAVQFRFEGIERVFAVKTVSGGCAVESVVDITETARPRFIGIDLGKAIEIEGEWRAPNHGRWRVLRFLRFTTNQYDFAHAPSAAEYAELLRLLKRENADADGLLWDEPGYICREGVLPFSDGIRRLVAERHGRDWESHVWRLAMDADDGSHTATRLQYYRAVQDTVMTAQEQAKRDAVSAWKKPLVLGIHDTWRWESADMNDMLHGSLDLWRSLRIKTGAWVDLGSIDLLESPRSHFHKNLAMNAALGASLARRASPQLAHNNLWIGGDGQDDATRNSIMLHCIRVLAAFGHCWTAHIYGPAGILDDAASFLGLPAVPGYPGHGTWKELPAYVSLLKSHRSLTGGALPKADVLMVFPVESMYMLGPSRASKAADEIFSLVLALLDAHVQVDIAAPTAFADYSPPLPLADAIKAILLPHCAELTPGLKIFIASRSIETIFLFGKPCPDRDGGEDFGIRASFLPDLACLRDFILKRPDLKSGEAPRGSWLTVTRLPQADLITLCPARHGRKYGGVLEHMGTRLRVPASSSMQRFVFHPDADVERILESER